MNAFEKPEMGVHGQVAAWLRQFESALQAGNKAGLEAVFQADSHVRDELACIFEDYRSSRSHPWRRFIWTIQRATGCRAKCGSLSISS